VYIYTKRYYTLVFFTNLSAGSESESEWERGAMTRSSTHLWNQYDCGNDASKYQGKQYYQADYPFIPFCHVYTKKEDTKDTKYRHLVSS